MYRFKCKYSTILIVILLLVSTSLYCQTCKGTKKDGNLCSFKANPECHNGTYCLRHCNQIEIDNAIKKGTVKLLTATKKTTSNVTCSGKKKDNTPCKLKASNGSRYCYHHKPCN
jgi:hypothetical protein